MSSTTASNIHNRIENVIRSVEEHRDSLMAEFSEDFILGLKTAALAAAQHNFFKAAPELRKLIVDANAHFAELKSVSTSKSLAEASIVLNFISPINDIAREITPIQELKCLDSAQEAYSICTKIISGMRRIPSADRLTTMMQDTVLGLRAELVSEHSIYNVAIIQELYNNLLAHRKFLTALHSKPDTPIPEITDHQNIDEPLAQARESLRSMQESLELARILDENLENLGKALSGMRIDLTNTKTIS